MGLGESKEGDDLMLEVDRADPFNRRLSHEKGTSACQRVSFLKEKKKREENIVTPLELDEEQMQAITGGCAQCDQDAAAAAIKDKLAAKYHKKAANYWGKYLHATDSNLSDYSHTKYQNNETRGTHAENAAAALRAQIADRHP
jgi:hypothetical protein